MRKTRRSNKMTDSITRQKSEAFAIRIVRLYRHLTETEKEYVLSKQMLRAGTSIGANIAEATFAMSRNDFLAKMYIALKECAETAYWLRLLHRTKFLSDKEYGSIAADCSELLKLLSSITKTVRLN